MNEEKNRFNVLIEQRAVAGGVWATTIDLRETDGETASRALDTALQKDPVKGETFRITLEVCE